MWAFINNFFKWGGFLQILGWEYPLEINLTKWGENTLKWKRAYNQTANKIAKTLKKKQKAEYQSKQYYEFLRLSLISHERSKTKTKHTY